MEGTILRSLFLATSLLAATFALPALAGEQDFKLVNKTGYQIDEVYVSRATSKSWGKDMMGKDALANNESVDLSFDAPDSVCKWDMRVKYSDGDTAEWSNLNLCSIETVTLFWDRKNQTTRAVTK
jgi:hypothetical protein